MMTIPQREIGDRVRVMNTDEAVEKGMAGREGTVKGVRDHIPNGDAFAMIDWDDPEIGEVVSGWRFSGLHSAEA